MCLVYVFLFGERGPRYSPVVRIVHIGNSVVSGEVETNHEKISATGADANLTLKERMAILDGMELVVGNESDSE